MGRGSPSAPCHLLLTVRQVGARGSDEQGAIFASSLKRSSVDVKRLRVGRGITGQGCALAFRQLPHYLLWLAFHVQEAQVCIIYREGWQMVAAKARDWPLQSQYTWKSSATHALSEVLR